MHRARHSRAGPVGQRAAKRLLRKLLKKQGRPPRILITDKLASYGAAKGEMMLFVEHRQHKGLNNRAEYSHQPTRRRERQMKGSNQPARRNVSSLPTTWSTTSSIPVATTSPLASIEPQGRGRSGGGPTSAGLLPQLELRASMSSACQFGQPRADK